MDDTNARLPLKETSGNIPSPTHKKAKLTKLAPHPVSISHNKPTLAQPQPQPKHFQVHTSHEKSNSKAARLVGEELRNWQVSWRKIMKESVVYFDTQGVDAANLTQNAEFKKARKALKLVGCAISPFFERQVSIIVSRRPFSTSKEYSSTDIFREAVQYKIKVWDYDKVFRFLKNLGTPDSSSNSILANTKSALSVNNSIANEPNTGELSNLLKEERIFGTTDRDPNARRDDLHYLDKQYLYVYDLSQSVRPIAIREWSVDNYPSIHDTLDGKCPFIPDGSENLERKKLRRAQKFAASQAYRDLLKAVSNDIINSAKQGFLLNTSGFTGTSTSTDRDEDLEKTIESKEEEVEEQEEEAEIQIDNIQENDTIIMENSSSSSKSKPKYNFRLPPAPLLRNSSCVQPSHNSNSNSNSKFYDVAASGYNGASNAMQFSMDSALNSNAAAQQGNGLGPVVSQVPSKNINNLKRRIFYKRQQQKPNDNSLKNQERELKPGYCENCRVKYDHFDDHIVSNRHRNFACDDRNFKSIDDLITILNESKSMGYITSNGDYSYSN